jgi:DNA-binding IclR family transcriptional regulator
MTSPHTHRSPWDDIEHAILTAAQQPATHPAIAEHADLTPDTVKAQLAALEAEGLVTQPVPGGGRYHLTLAGYKRMFELADATPVRLAA